MKIKITWRIAFKLIIIAVIIIFAFILAVGESDNELINKFVDRFGYFGVFILAIVSGFNVVIPVPLIVFMQSFIDAGLAFGITIVVISFGMTLGDTIGYMLGQTGKEMLKEEVVANQQILERISSWRDRHVKLPFIVLFLYACFAPAPNEILMVPMGFLGFKLKYIFPIMLAGNFVFNTLVAYGIIGLISIIGLF